MPLNIKKLLRVLMNRPNESLVYRRSVKPAYGHLGIRPLERTCASICAFGFLDNSGRYGVVAAFSEAAEVIHLAWISNSPRFDSVLQKGATISLISQRSTLRKG